MKLHFFKAMLALLLTASLPAAAQERGLWRASSSNAKQITGDVEITDTKLVMNFMGFPIAQIRQLQPAELAAVFDADSNAGGGAYLYRLSVAATQRILHRNTLCGSEQTDWMVTYVSGRTLHLAFFSGSTMPVFTFEAMQNSSELCGTFSYER